MGSLAPDIFLPPSYRFRSIQFLRAVAALLVVSHHLTEARFLTGAAGVDLFFVISGFIIGTVGPGEKPAAFAAKRTLRVVPLYWLVTLGICAISSAAAMARFHFEGDTLLKSLLFIPYRSASGEILPLVAPGWTLNFEMFFYVLFTVGLVLQTPIRFASAVLLALVLAGLLISPESAPLRIWTSPLLLEFLAGLLLATALRPKGLVLGIGLIATGLAALVAAAVLSLYSEAWRVLSWGLPSATILCGCLAIERANRWPEVLLRPFEHVGDASYSLYLTHLYVIVAVQRRFGTALTPNLLALIASLLTAFLSYHLVEKPFGRLMRSDRRPGLPGRRVERHAKDAARSGAG